MRRVTEGDPVNCWREIGISGDFSCPRLKELIHCRNCAEYNRAGRQLLDREIPKEFLEEWTRDLTAVKEDERRETLSVIIFRIGGEWLALRTVCLQETASVRAIHHVPFRSNNVFRGVVNINGELLLCVSAADLLEYGSRQTGDEAGQRSFPRMLVVRLAGERYVFPVDEVLGIHRVPADNLYDPPATMSKSPNSFIKAIFDFAEKRVGFLDEARLSGTFKRSLVA